VAFIASTFFAWRELKYTLAGKTAIATVEEVTDITVGGRRRVGLKHYDRNVTYQFRDAAGNDRRDTDWVPLNWLPPPSGTVTVQYLDDSSRLAGNRNVIGLILFFVSGAAVCVGGYLFWRHIREATRPSAPAKPAPRPQPYRY
jgi:hypothetical protein